MITAIVLAASLLAAQPSLTIDKITDSQELARFIYQETQRVNGTTEFIAKLYDTGTLHLEDTKTEIPLRFVYATVLEEMQAKPFPFIGNREVIAICSFIAEDGTVFRFHIGKFTDEDIKGIVSKLENRH